MDGCETLIVGQWFSAPGGCVTRSRAGLVRIQLRGYSQLELLLEVFSPPSSHSSLLFLPIAIHPYESVYIIYITISILDILLRLGTSIKLRSNSTTSTSHLRTAPHQPCPTPDPHGRRLDNRLSSCIVFFSFFHDQGVKTRRDKLYINCCLPALPALCSVFTKHRPFLSIASFTAP